MKTIIAATVAVMFIAGNTASAHTSTSVKLETSVSNDVSAKARSSGATIGGALDTGARVGSEVEVGVGADGSLGETVGETNAMVEVGSESSSRAQVGDEITVILHEAESETTSSMSSTDLSTALQASSAIYLKLGDVKGESSESSTHPSEIIVVGSKVREVFGDESIANVTVRGWDPTTKKVITSAHVQTAEDLALLAAATANADSHIENVSFNFEKIRVDYETEGRLIGFIPLRYRQRAEVDLGGKSGVVVAADFNDRVKVRFPWYAFLMKKAVLKTDLETSLVQALEASVGLDNLASASLSEQLVAQARVFVAVSNTLKTKHDTAMASIQNLK